MMTLPQELKRSFNELTRYEEEITMPLLNNMELEGMEKNAQDSVIIVLRSLLACRRHIALWRNPR